jgi:hypothetical protein
MLAVAIERDYVSEVVVARESDTGPQGRRLAAIFRQWQASSSGSSGNLRRPVAGSVVDHHNLCNMPPDPRHNLRDVRGFVEGRN